MWDTRRRQGVAWAATPWSQMSDTVNRRGVAACCCRREESNASTPLPSSEGHRPPDDSCRLSAPDHGCRLRRTRRTYLRNSHSRGFSRSGKACRDSRRTIEVGRGKVSRTAGYADPGSRADRQVILAERPRSLCRAERAPVREGPDETHAAAAHQNRWLVALSVGGACVRRRVTLPRR